MGNVCPRVSWLLLPMLALAACGGGGGGSSDGEETDTLVVVKFALVDQLGGTTGARGTTNAFRNNRVEFTFSAKVDPTTVSDRTISIGIPSGSNLFLQAIGRFEVDGNRVLFDPTVTQVGAPKPFGFEADSVYQVRVRSHPDPKTIETLGGKPVVEEFSTTFSTTGLYLPDLDQPRIETIQPSPDEVDVDSRADVVVLFSEAMNPATFDAKTTFKVTNLWRDREVFGVFRFSDDAREVTFRPTFGYGRGPYDIEVELGVGLTDLAGNAIANPQKWIFTTIYDETAVNEGLVEEYFDNKDYEDTTFVGPNGEAIATWNDPQTPGLLNSVFGVATVQVPIGTSNSGVFPSVGTGTWANARAQVVYQASELNQPAGTISQLWWRVYSSPYTGSGNVWTGLTVQLGHTTSYPLSSVFASNYNVGSPVTVVNNVTYTVPSNSGMTYLPFPLSRNFNYDGSNNIIVDVAKTSSTAVTNCAWAFLNGVTGRYVYGTPSTAASGSAVSYFVQSQFGFRTETSMARSLWYRTDSADPTYLASVASPVEQPPGTEMLISYQGAEGDETTSGDVDPSTITDLTEDVTDLDGYEYIRFQVSFKANLGTGIGPTLQEILIPYIFF